MSAATTAAISLETFLTKAGSGTGRKAAKGKPFQPWTQGFMTSNQVHVGQAGSFKSLIHTYMKFGQAFAFIHIVGHIGFMTTRHPVLSDHQ